MDFGPDKLRRLAVACREAKEKRSRLSIEDLEMLMEKLEKALDVSSIANDVYDIIIFITSEISTM